MQTTTLHLGPDVHKDSITIAIAEGDGLRSASIYSPLTLIADCACNHCGLVGRVHLALLWATERAS